MMLRGSMIAGGRDRTGERGPVTAGRSYPALPVGAAPVTTTVAGGYGAEEV